MKGIERITIQNFKAFRQKKTFHLKGKHLLVYGNNGSGKSSLYFALYTILQSVTKPLSKIQNYFDRFNDENLLNIYERWNKSSFIKMVLTDNKRKVYALNKNGLIPSDRNQRKTINEMNLASEFISHRLLINFYNFRNSKEIDLFQVFDKDIFPYVQYSSAINIIFEDMIKDLKNRGELGLRGRRQLIQWKSDITDLNNKLEQLIIYINNNANTFLHKYFHFKELKIILNLKKGFDYRKIGRTAKYELLSPFIKLSIQQLKPKKKDIDRPQSFLNEARLTAIALSIRFIILEKRPKKPDIKILALDDLLISLDMSNRMSVLKIIFDLYEKNYQLFFFTHDKGFYDEIKRWTKVKDTSWNYLVFKDPVDNIIKTENDKDDIDRANQFLTDNDFDSCALAIRKSLENSIKEFLMKQNQYQSGNFIALTKQIHTAQTIILNKTHMDFKRIITSFDLPHNILIKYPVSNDSDINALPGLTNEQKIKLKEIRKATTKLIINSHKEHLEMVSLLNEAEQYVARALNLGAHTTVAPLYKRELDNALVIAENLKKKLKDLKL